MIRMSFPKSGMPFIEKKNLTDALKELRRILEVLNVNSILFDGEAKLRIDYELIKEGEWLDEDGV